MTVELKGRWKKGFAYDVHTLASTYLGVDEFGHGRYENERSEMGELLYQLKYKNKKELVIKIVDLLARFKGLESMDAIIPIPSTNKGREFQPVELIAEELGKRNNVVVLKNVLIKSNGGTELKNVEEVEDRQELLKASMSLKEGVNLKDKNVLLVDDLYRSGTTLNVAADLLYDEAEVENVYVLTMTKTRTSR